MLWTFSLVTLCAWLLLVLFRGGGGWVNALPLLVVALMVHRLLRAALRR